MAIPVNLLSTATFERRAARWATFITAPSASELQRSFTTQVGEKAQRLNYVSFPIQQLELLASTVGVRNIQVRFLIASTIVDGKSVPHFTLALYATDALGVRISAFYQPLDYWLLDQQPNGATDFEVTPASSTPAGQAPHSLVKMWVNNWTGTAEIPTPEIGPHMFANSYGPLRGYTFSLDDFMQPLFESQKFTDEEVEKLTVRISFALHEYYPASAHHEEPKQTFGLVLRLDSSAVPNPVLAAAHAANTPPTSGEPFFDLSTPCPPGYESV